MSLSRSKIKELLEGVVDRLVDSEDEGDRLVELCERIYMIESTYGVSSHQIKSDIRDAIVRSVDTAGS